MMTNFIKSLLKQFHPDNKDSGNKETFIKLKDKIDSSKDLEFNVHLTIKDLINGKTITLGEETFELNKKCNPYLQTERFVAKDGTIFFVKYTYEKYDINEGIEIRKGIFTKTIELNMFDAIFGDKRIEFSIFGDKKTFYIKPYMNIKTDKTYETDYKIKSHPLYLRFIVQITDKDTHFINKLRKLYEEN